MVITVENRASEIADELQKHVFLFSCQLIEACLFSSRLDLSRGQTSFDIGVEPILRDLKELARAFVAGKYSLEKRCLLGLCGISNVIAGHLRRSFGETTISVGGNVSNEVGILALVLVGIPSIGEGDSLTLWITVLEVFVVLFRHIDCVEWRD